MHAFSAHLDTVFPAEAIGEPVQEGSILRIPGASDNCAGITALLAVAAAMRAAGLKPESDILFASNVGEEGEGNLRGMRYLFSQSPHAARIRSAVILDGAGTDTIVTQGLGSKRFRVTISGPGGHSWTDAGVPNPILILADALAAMGRIPMARIATDHVEHRSHGGRHVHQFDSTTVPEARIDTRSTDGALLLQLEEELVNAVTTSVDEANGAARVDRMRVMGRDRFNLRLRPLESARLRRCPGTREFCGRCGLSTGMNPESLQHGFHGRKHSAIAGCRRRSLGSGGRGGGVHTLEEWFDAAGRDLGLRRILLLLLALAQPEA